MANYPSSILTPSKRRIKRCRTASFGPPALKKKFRKKELAKKGFLAKEENVRFKETLQYEPRGAN